MRKIILTAAVFIGLTATAQVKIGTNPNTLSNSTSNFEVEGTTGTDQFIILKNGNVGIGTTTIDAWDPLYDVLKIGNISSLAQLNTAIPFTVLGNNYFESSTGHRQTIAGLSSYIRLVNGEHQFVNTNVDNGAGNLISRISSMTIKSNGNVGIGTTTPSSILEVQSNDPVLQIADNDLTTRLATIRIGTGGGNWDIINNNDLNFRFGTDVVTFQRFSGNVGIGTTAPSQKLHVEGNTKLNGILHNGAVHQNVLQVQFPGTTVDGYKILTNINNDANTSEMYTVVFTGYAYGIAKPINISVSFYSYSIGPVITNSGVSVVPGSWEPTSIKLANEGGKIVILLEGQIYYGSMNLTVYKGTNGSLLDSTYEGWSFSDAALAGTATNVVTFLPANYSSTITNVLSSAVNTMTSNVKGISSTASIIQTNDLSFVAPDKIRSTINGVVSNDLPLNVNSVSTTAVAAGTITENVIGGNTIYSTIGTGVIMLSPNGDKWKVTVGDSGVLTIVKAL